MLATTGWIILDALGGVALFVGGMFLGRFLATPDHLDPLEPLEFFPPNRLVSSWPHEPDMRHVELNTAFHDGLVEGWVS